MSNVTQSTPTPTIADLASRIDSLRDYVLQLEAKLAAQPAAVDKTPRVKFPVPLNGTEIWLYDITGLEAVEDKRNPGNMIYWCTTKNGKNVPTDEFGLVTFDSEYDIVRAHLEANQPS